jgi:prefoldin subunit 5
MMVFNSIEHRINYLKKKIEQNNERIRRLYNENLELKKTLQLLHWRKKHDVNKKN